MTTQEVRVFGYGSLVSARSLAHALGHHPGAVRLARLSGWRRDWNVGSDRGSHPERRFIRNDGSEFLGVTVVLGLTAIPGAHCTGTVFPVYATDLARLDMRERNYERVDVTTAVEVLDRGSRRRSGGDGGVVYAYLPRAAAVSRLRTALAHGREVNVRAGYLSVVRTALDELGAGRQADCQVPPVPFPIEEMAVRIDDRTLPTGPAHR